MIRWIRIALIGVVAVALIGVGIVVGLLLFTNRRWITMQVPEWLDWMLGDRPLEIWLPALLAGWLVAFFGLAALLVWSMFYVWRRRQYESLIHRLEKELAQLRNLPFTRPAPLEDLPEEPSDEGARVTRLAEQVDNDLDAGPRPERVGE